MYPVIATGSVCASWSTEFSAFWALYVIIIDFVMGSINKMCELFL